MFSKKVVIVTGASSGIGAAIAVGFAKEQADVCITGRNVENLEKTAKKCVEAGGAKPLMLVGNIADGEHRKDIVDSTVRTFGRIDVLINNAGVMIPKSLETTTVEDYEVTFDTNVKAVIFLTQLVVPHLVQTKGNVVNISSLAGIKSFPGALVYNLSKATLDQFTKCTALELASRGVRVNSINPGYIPTNITRSFALSDEKLKMLDESYKKVVPLGRSGEVRDVVEAAMYLASDRASFVTGHLLPIDGGRGVVTPRSSFE